jgi:cytidylate kinase
MSIVVISKLSYTKGEVIAQKVASQLGYKCIDQEILQDASQRSQVPIEKIRKAVTEAPSLLGMSLAARRRSIAHLQAAICARLLEDNVVYHGPLGHLLVKGVTHVVNVRILASKEERVAHKIKLEGCDLKDAEKAISKEDKHRLSIARDLFGVKDDDDGGAFNLVVNTSEMEMDTAARIIAETANHERYKPMTYSLRCMKDLELSSRLKALLIDLDPDIAVQAKKGDVRIRTKVSGRAKVKRSKEIQRRIEGQDGVTQVEVETVADLADQIDRRLR